MMTSFRDQVTGVLKAYGFVSSNDEGDISQPESDNFNLTPGLWQWNGSEWVPYTPAPLPDVKGFEDDLKVIFVDPLTINSMMRENPLFLWCLRDQNWPYVAGILAGALAAGDITQAHFDAIHAAAVTRHIPIGAP